MILDGRRFVINPYIESFSDIRSKNMRFRYKHRKREIFIIGYDAVNIAHTADGRILLAHNDLVYVSGKMKR